MKYIGEPMKAVKETLAIAVVIVLSCAVNAEHSRTRLGDAQKPVSVTVNVVGIGSNISTTTPAGIDRDSYTKTDSLIEAKRQYYAGMPSPNGLEQLHGLFKAVYLHDEGPTYNRETFLSLGATSKKFKWYDVIHGEKASVLHGSYHFEGSSIEMTNVGIVVGGVPYEDVITFNNGLAFEYVSDKHVRIYGYSPLEELLWLDYIKVEDL
jgi:hypothetical protein